MISLVLLAAVFAIPGLASPTGTPVGSSYPIQTETVITAYTYAPASDPGPAVVPGSVAGLTVQGNPDVNPGVNVGKYKSALLLSFDGFHASDLTAFVKSFPKSNIAAVVGHGINFPNAKTSSPSDSFPGTQAYLTGASSRTHGVYYDVSYDRELYPPGSNCVGPQGFAVAFDETIDLNSTIVTGGGGIDETMLPLFKTNWGTCAPVYPWDFVRVNNVFEVARFAGLQTAYSDKHPAYTIAQGPSGFGLSEGYFPEINAFNTVADTESYDDLHWIAVNNWASGKHFNGSVWTELNGGAPAIFGANFQSVSVAEKSAGYNASTLAPNPNLAQAMQYLDGKLGALITTMKAAKTYNSTLLILTAKHGQSPINRAELRWINGDSLINATGVSVPGQSADDGAYLWLQNASDAPKAKANLLANKAALGIAEVWIWPEVIANGFGDPRFDSRAPDIVVKTIPGVIYTGGSYKKTAEHGGLNPDDVDVLLVVHNPSFSNASSNSVRISTRSVAPTILKALGLDPMFLEGVRKESTPVIPGVPL